MATGNVLLDNALGVDALHYVPRLTPEEKEAAGHDPAEEKVSEIEEQIRSKEGPLFAGLLTSAVRAVYCLGGVCLVSTNMNTNREVPLPIWPVVPVPT